MYYLAMHLYPTPLVSKGDADGLLPGDLSAFLPLILSISKNYPVVK